MFRQKFPVAWAFHRNTSRWPHNVLTSTQDIDPGAPYKEYLDAPLVPLPAPVLPTTSLGAALAARASCRLFDEAPLPLVSLATILTSAYGVTGQYSIEQVEYLARPVPSGGGLYPLEIYLFVRRVEGITPGIYHYAILPHSLEQIAAVEMPPAKINELFMFQPYAAEASAVVILTSVIARSLWKYTDRGYRYILFEAGHVAQNINLMATALGLGSVNLGGFLDTAIADLLRLDTDTEFPLYGIALGVPRATGHDRGLAAGRENS